MIRIMDEAPFLWLQKVIKEASADLLLTSLSA